jgi:hypothetical protein
MDLGLADQHLRLEVWKFAAIPNFGVFGLPITHPRPVSQQNIPFPLQPAVGALYHYTATGIISLQTCSDVCIIALSHIIGFDSTCFLHETLKPPDSRRENPTHGPKIVRCQSCGWQHFVAHQ